MSLRLDWAHCGARGGACPEPGGYYGPRGSIFTRGTGTLSAIAAFIDSTLGFSSQSKGTTMKTLANKLALSSALVLVLGIGSAALSYAAQPKDATNTAKICQPLQASVNPGDRELLRKTDIRWAQSELRSRGLYHGSLDGVLGSETKAAILQLQKNAGLGQTASLDARTWAVLTGEVEAGEGSSMPPAGAGGASLPGSPAASGLGR